MPPLWMESIESSLRFLFFFLPITDDSQIDDGRLSGRSQGLTPLVDCLLTVLNLSPDFASAIHKI